MWSREGRSLHDREGEDNRMSRMAGLSAEEMAVLAPAWDGVGALPEGGLTGPRVAFIEGDVEEAEEEVE